MIKVYAFEPSAILDPILMQALESFGFDHGRIIGRVPKDWRKQVGDVFREAISDGSDPKALEIALERLAKKNAIQKVELSSLENETWLDKACAVSVDHVHGIICSDSNSNSDPRIISRLDINDDNLVWKQESGLREIRQPKEMAEKTRVLLRFATEVKFIDPHYAGEKEHTNFFVECIKTLDSLRKEKRPKLEIHFSYRVSAADELHVRKQVSRPVFETILKKTKCELSETTIPIKLFQWSSTEDGDRFHERYVVSDLGGIEFGGGLSTGRASEKTSVNRLSSSVREELFANYKAGSDVYDLLHHATL